MLELLFVMALTIMGVVLAVLGVGMASGSGRKKNVDVIEVPFFKEKLNRPLEKIQSVKEKIIEPIKQVNQDSGLRELRAYLQAGYTFLTEGTGQGLKADLNNAIYKGILTGNKGNVEWGLQEVMGDSANGVINNLGLSSKKYAPNISNETYKSLVKSGNSPYNVKKDSELSSAQRNARYEILADALKNGISPKKINVYFTDDLSNETDRGMLYDLGNGSHDMYLAAELHESQLVETGKHENRHIKYPKHNEAQINKELFEERIKDTDKYLGELLAQTSYIEELSVSENPENRDIAKKFKEICPKGKELLDDNSWKEKMSDYREITKYKGKLAS